MKEMDKKKKNRGIPETLKAKLAASGIKEEILCRTEVDMDTAGEYADGYLLLTATKLIVALLPPDSRRVRSFRGFGEQDSPDGAWVLRTFDAGQVESVWVEDCIGCNLIVGRIGGMEMPLAGCSNFPKRRIVDFVRAMESWPKDGTVKPMKEPEEEYCPKCGRMYPDPRRKVCPHCENKTSILFRILKYFKPYWPMALGMMLCIVATGALNLVWPYLNGTVLYDRILAKDPAFLKQIGLGEGKFALALLLLVLTMFLTKLTLLLAQVLQGVCSSRMVVQVVRDMKKDIFSKMGKLSIGFYRSRQTGGLMTRVLSDADRVSGFFVDQAPYVLVHLFTITFTVIVMWSLNWQMTVLTVVLLPLLAAVSFLLQPRVWVMFGKRHRAERSLNSCVSDNLTGARVVKAFGQESRESKRFASYSDRLERGEVSISYWQNYFQLFYGGAQELASCAVWALGTYFIFGGENMDLGLLITFAGYVSQLQGPMRFLANISHRMADSLNSAQRIFEIIDAVPEVEEAEKPVHLEKIRGELRLEHVTFGYEVNRAVLKNVSLTIPAGQMIGLVGRSGAGKSTLVNLISRLYDPQEGRILLDGVDIRDLAFSDLRKNVALVSQETYIFSGTVMQNIAYSNPDASPWEIVEAAKLAGAHEFIMRMPDGYDTMIGASGKGLSGGERQRISIARAILADPKILILDEATASVDTETERMIQKSLKYLVKGRTTISIAHRLSTLRDADYLYVIDHGVIAEQGTHEHLKEQQGIFYKLLELQTRALAMRGVD